MTGNEQAKALIESMKPVQLNPGMEGYSFSCPRCGRDNMDKQPPMHNALSRYADVYICDECGRDEALRDTAGVKPLPFKKWAVARNYGG